MLATLTTTQGLFAMESSWTKLFPSGPQTETDQFLMLGESAESLEVFVQGGGLTGHAALADDISPQFLSVKTLRFGVTVRDLPAPPGPNGSDEASVGDFSSNLRESFQLEIIPESGLDDGTDWVRVEVRATVGTGYSDPVGSGTFQVDGRARIDFQRLTRSGGGLTATSDRGTRSADLDRPFDSSEQIWTFAARLGDVIELLPALSGNFQIGKDTGLQIVGQGTATVSVGDAPDIEAIAGDWDSVVADGAQRKLRVSYGESDAYTGMPIPNVRLYWASGPGESDRLVKAYEFTPTFEFDMPGGFFHDLEISLNQLSAPPPGATHIHVVADEDDVLHEKYESNNFEPIDIRPAVSFFDFQHADTADAMSITYEITPGLLGEPDEFDLGFFRATDLDRDPRGDTELPYSFTVSTSGFSNVPGAVVELVGETASHALDPGFHFLRIFPRANSPSDPLIEALLDKDATLILAVPDPRNTIEERFETVALDPIQESSEIFPEYQGVFQAGGQGPVAVRGRTIGEEFFPEFADDEITLADFGTSITLNDETRQVSGVTTILVVTLVGDDEVLADDTVAFRMVVLAGDGNDVVVGGTDEDEIDGGKGNDILLGEGFENIPPRTLGDMLEDLADFKLLVAAPLVPLSSGGEDRIKGGEGNDFILGGPENDTIDGGTGLSVVFGDSFQAEVGLDLEFRALDFLAFLGDFELVGDGWDTIDTGDGSDVIVAGGGNDTVHAGDGAIDFILGNDGDDLLHGESGLNVILGGADDDRLFGGDAGNLLLGDSWEFQVPLELEFFEELIKGNFKLSGIAIKASDTGADEIRGGGGIDVMLGGDGDDSLWGGDDSFNVAFGDGLDITIPLSIEVPSLLATLAPPISTLAIGFYVVFEVFELTGEGEDTYEGGDGTDIVFGGDGPDHLYGRGDWDYLVGGGGDDDVDAGPGSWSLLGGVAFGGPGNDVLRGGDFSDHLESEGGDDQFFGLGGDDFIHAGAGADVIHGGDGDDELHGEDGDDSIYGEEGDDRISGGDGDDLLSGGPGQDEFDGGPGNNRVEDDVAPTVIRSLVIDSASPQRSVVRSLTIDLSALATVDPAAFEVRTSSGVPVGLEVTTSLVEGKTQVVLTFLGQGIVGGSLADGAYTLTVRGDGIVDARGLSLDGDLDGKPGGDRVDRFFRLFGDSDGDGDVDNTDTFAFKAALNTRAGQVGYLSIFDYDLDGVISVLDFTEMKKRYGKKMFF